MKKTIKTIVLAALCLFFSAEAVHSQGLTIPLKVGDKVPELTLNKVINHPGGNLKLSDFKGKLLILDFWATWCAVCLKSIPHTDSLQRAFEGKVVFLSVTYQTDKEVDAYLAKLEKIKPGLTARSHPRIVEDKILHGLFPHTTLPHYVWINGEGVVKAITESRAVNAENITRLLLTGSINTLEKQYTKPIPHKKDEPILSALAGKVPSILGHSFISGYIPGLPAGLDIIKATETHSRKILLRNVPLTWHYRAAYSDGKKWFSDASIILDVKDSTKIEPPKASDYNSWISENGYCYELLLPKSLDAQVYPRMQEDLKTFFPDYEAFTEFRNRKVLALVRTSDRDKLATAGGTAKYKLTGLQASLKNTSLNMLTSQLNMLFLQHLPTPVVNETGYSGKVDMELNTDLSDVGSLNTELLKYDLQLIEKEKEVQVLVIRDKNRL